MYPLDAKETPPADVVTSVVEHEFFKFHVQKQVETRTHEYLSGRAKTVGAIASVVLTVLGAFGVQQYLSFNAVVKQLETRFTSLQEKSTILDKQIVEAERLLQQAEGAVNRSTALIDLARQNVDSSRAITDGAGATARQTSDLAKVVLEQAHTAQQGVQLRNRELNDGIESALRTLDTLSRQQESLKSMKKQIDEASEDVTSKRKEVNEAHKTVITTSTELTKRLDVEKELAKAKTFEFVLLRDGHGAEITLPDFRDAGKEVRRQYKLFIEAVRIKDVVDFRITVNGRKSAHAFDRFKQGDVAPIGDLPFTVRVDSIYHAKLAFDFVLLRLNPSDSDGVTPPGPVLASATDRRN